MVHSFGRKDAFFTIFLHQDSQYLFAFDWEDPFTRERQQYMWIVLPQGFRDSPHLFARDLQLRKGGLPQYIDDLLICSPTQDISNANTILVLNFLAIGDIKSPKTKPKSPYRKSAV
jgi:hypothetical protein